MKILNTLKTIDLSLFQGLKYKEINSLDTANECNATAEKIYPELGSYYLL